MKKEWKKPQLVVVVRGSDEERVLSGCKSFLAGGPLATDLNCIGLAVPAACLSCQFDGSS